MQLILNHLKHGSETCIFYLILVVRELKLKYQIVSLSTSLGIPVKTEILDQKRIQSQSRHNLSITRCQMFGDLFVSITGMLSPGEKNVFYK